MKLLSFALSAMTALITLTSCSATIKNAVTEQYHVAGNCGMCKATIEKAATEKGVSRAEWNTDTKVLQLTYDTQRISAEELLKRIAYAGYDNEQFLAPDEAYAQLASCCHYDRMKKEMPAILAPETPVTEQTTESSGQQQAEEPAPLAAVYSSYFTLKDALVKDDAASASRGGALLIKAIEGVNASVLSSEERTVWQKAKAALAEHAAKIGSAKDIAVQREQFAELSKALYPVIQTIRADHPVYRQHCPMYNGGADWLSKENAVKNPFYGSSMLTCGKTTETIR